MSTKNKTEVLIGGRIYTLSGYESEEYLQKVATYMNNKISEFGKMEGFSRLSNDNRGILLQLNIADDYFKAKKQVGLVEEELTDKEKELYELKHELIDTRIQLENALKDKDALEKANMEAEKKIVRLETEMKERNVR